MTAPTLPARLSHRRRDDLIADTRAMAVEPLAEIELVRCLLASALSRLQANPLDRKAHAIAKAALANNADYETRKGRS